MSDLYPCLCTARKERSKATRTGCREYGRRTRHFRSRPCSPDADDDIAARGEEASFTRTEYRKQVTHSRRLLQRDIHLLCTILQTDLLGARLVERVIQPLKITRRVVRAWLAAGRDLYTAAGVSVLVGDWGQVRHGPGVLGVEICPQT